AAVVDGKREHPFQPVHTRGAILLVRVQNRFGVGFGAELMTARQELGPKAPMVVDFAVEYNPQRLVFVGHRLCAAGPVDNRAPPRPGSAAIQRPASIVRLRRPALVARGTAPAVPFLRWRPLPAFPRPASRPPGPPPPSLRAASMRRLRGSSCSRRCQRPAAI